MSDTDEDLEALFDEVATQSTTANHSKVAISTDSTEEESPIVASDPAPFDQNTNKPIFDRLGGVVRVLHDSMRELGYDRSLAEATSQISDVHGRLEHIATLTEQAANKVLNATDQGMPAQDELAKKAKNIEERWNALFEGKVGIEEFKELANDSRTFAQETIKSTEAEKARLLEIMMSQDFQDLTGQLIKKVTAITSEVERELAQILIDNAPVTTKEKTLELMQGPSTPASAMAQDDVDNLLDSLGF